MTKKNKKSNKLKKYPLPVIVFVTAACLLVLFVIGSFIYGEYQNHQRTHQLRETDKDMQKFGDMLEKSFPGKVHREKYCRHDGVKLGNGALRCITRIGIDTNYYSEDGLLHAIEKINISLNLVPYFNFNNVAIPTKSAENISVSSGLERFNHYNTGKLCNMDYAFVHFDSEAIERRGEFSFSAHCTAGPLQKPIYKLQD
jgi:hypothetical protein